MAENIVSWWTLVNLRVNRGWIWYDLILLWKTTNKISKRRYWTLYIAKDSEKVWEIFELFTNFLWNKVQSKKKRKWNDLNWFLRGKYLDIRGKTWRNTFINSIKYLVRVLVYLVYNCWSWAFNEHILFNRSRIEF